MTKSKTATDWKHETKLCNKCIEENHLDSNPECYKNKLKMLKENIDKLPKIENLCFSGGGVRCVSYLGSVYILEQLKMLDNIKRVSGTSGGALMALLIALNYDIDSMYTVVTDDQSKYLDRGLSWLNWWYYLFNKNYGIYKGKVLEDDIKSFINNKFDKDFPEFRKSKGDNYQPTFNDIYTFYKKELIVTGTNLSKLGVEFFCPKLTPDMPVYIAVRISASLPACFESVNYNNCRYVDGGLAENFPIDIYCDRFKEKYLFCNKDDKTFEQTLGFNLMSKGVTIKEDPNGVRDDVESIESQNLDTVTKFLYSIIDFYSAQNFEDEMLIVNILNNEKQAFLKKVVKAYTPCMGTADFKASIDTKIETVIIFKYLTVEYFHKILKVKLKELENKID